MEPIILTILTGLVGSGLGILSHWGVVRYRQGDSEKKIKILEERVNNLNDKIINKHEEMERRFTAELSTLKNEVHQLRLNDEKISGKFALFEEKIAHIDKNIDTILIRLEKVLIK